MKKILKRYGISSVGEIVLKILIIVIFLSMNEISYLVKLLGIAIFGAAVIIDWYTIRNNN